MSNPTIILDFGAVILNIDFQKTIDAFSLLGINNFESIFSKHKQSSFMQAFEKGEVSPSDFRSFIRSHSDESLTNDQIDSAWNALLLDYPANRINLLQELGKDHALFLLSNTNSIHHDKFQSDFIQQFGFKLDSLFRKAYYSHKMADRKPNVSCYQSVLHEQQLDAKNTIFIDDTLVNVVSANELGMRGVHLTNKEELTDLLPRVLTKFYQ